MALIETLIDSFHGNAISANWNTSLSADSTQVYNRNNQIEITHTANIQYNTLSTATTYDITSSAASVRVTDAGNQALVSHDCIFEVYVDASNELFMVAENGNLSAFKKVVGVQLQVGSSVTYSAITHKFWRLRESGGTFFWDTSDGVTWVNRWSLVNPFAVTAVKLLLQSGCYANEASGSYACFDNFNILPQIGVTQKHVSISGSGMGRNDQAS